MIAIIAAILGGVFLGPAALGQVCEEAYLERIEVVSETNIRPSTVASYIEISPGTCTTTEALDDALIRGQTRLRLIGVFESVSFALRKGSERNWYVVEANIIPRSLYYVGGFSKFHWADDRLFKPLFYEEERGQLYGLFLGSRGLFGSDLRADIEYNHSQTSNRSSYNYTLEADDRLISSTEIQNTTEEEGNDFYLNLFHPALFGSNFVAGFNYTREFSIYNDTTQENRKVFDEDAGLPDGEDGIYRTRDRFLTQGFLGKVGYRYEQLSLFASVSRNIAKSIPQHGSGDTEYSTLYGPQVTLTNKTFLTIMEPGYFGKLTYNIGDDPDPETYFTFDGEYSYFVAPYYALTPFSDLIWYDSDGELTRMYGFGLRQQYAASRDFIIELESVGITWTGQSGGFQRRATLTLRYLRPTISYDFALQLGPSLDFFENDRRRISE